jgi:Recombination DNA repair protein (RAD52 pathway)
MAKEKTNKPKTDIQTVYTNLQKELPANFVLKRQDGLSYIAGYIAIEQANRIFGFDKWGYTVTQQPILTKDESEAGEKVWYYTCAIKSWVKMPGSDYQVEREDVGYAEVTFTKVYTDKQGKKTGGRPQFEVAYKGAITDALKRALRGWGNQFGNSLYDREDKIVNVQQTLSTAEEIGLSGHVQELMNCKTLDEVEKTLDKLVQIATQDNWNQAQTSYIKTMAEKVKKGLQVKESRQASREKKEGETKK